MSALATPTPGLAKTKLQQKKLEEAKDPKPPPPPVPIVFPQISVLEDAIHMGILLHENDAFKAGNSVDQEKYDDKLDGALLDKLREVIREDEQNDLADIRLEHQAVHTMNAVRATIDVMEGMKVQNLISAPTSLIQIEIFSARKANELITNHSTFSKENCSKEFLDGITALQEQVLVVGYRCYCQKVGLFVDLNSGPSEQVKILRENLFADYRNRAKDFTPAQLQIQSILEKQQKEAADAYDAAVADHLKKIDSHRPLFKLSQIEDVQRQLLQEVRKRFQAFQEQQAELFDRFDVENNVKEPPEGEDGSKRKKADTLLDDIINKRIKLDGGVGERVARGEGGKGGEREKGGGGC